MPILVCKEMTVLEQIEENYSNHNQNEKSCGCNFSEQGELECAFSLMPEPLNDLY